MDAPLAGFVAVLGAVGALRLGELAVSRARMRRRPDAVIAEPALFPAMAALHAGLVALPVVEVVLLGRPFVAPLAAVAGAVLVVATGLRVWTLWTIGRSWNVRVVRPERIATTGPYAWIRHPNYLVVALEIAALPLLHTAVLSSIGLSIANALVLKRRIATEEATLLEIPAWREAFAAKPRLVPGLW